MNNETMVLLEKYFDVAFAAPNGVKKLRKLILSMAMQGKLVAQDPHDVPASELLKEIEAEKNRLVKDGKIKQSKPLAEIKPDEVPYDLPKSWEWVSLGNIATFENGDRSSRYPNENDHQVSGIPFFGAKDMVGGVLRFDNGLRFISEAKFLELSNGKLIDRDFVVLLRGTVGKFAIFRSTPEFSTGFINAQMLIVRMMNKEFCDFFSSYSSSILFQSLVSNKITGSAIKQMPANVVLNFLVPLPPLAEQSRIVAKIDELMARCDELEKLRGNLNQKQITVHNAALNRLLTAKDQSDFNTAWQFITQHFGDLYSVKENVAELRKVILQLAVMGKLVPQDPSDRPASELLKEIEKEKERLVKEGKIKKSKPLPKIVEEEKKFILPTGWNWSRLQDVLDVRDGTHDSPQDANGTETYPLVTSKNFVNGKIDFSSARQISAHDHFEIVKRSKVDKLDILFSMIGGNIGNQVIIEEERDFSIKNVALFKYYNNQLTYPYFIKRYLEHLAIGLQAKAAGGAQPFVSLGFLRNLVIALPPKEEQHRIVAKIDQLMTLCDNLEKQINNANSKQTNLLNAVMTNIGS